jgi:uncharacterized protein (DUF2147 family)
MGPRRCSSAPIGFVTIVTNEVTHREVAMLRPVWTVVGALSPLLTNTSAYADGITGVWIDHTGRGGVEISECGANLCGRIVWLKDAANKEGCGVQVIGNARSVGKDTWDGGWIYDPEKNARYSVELKPIGSDKLRVTGYMGSKLFSEIMIWKRAPADLARCDGSEPASAQTKPPTGTGPASAPERGGAGSTGGAQSTNPAKDKAGPQPGCTRFVPQIGTTVPVPCPR